MIFVKIVNDLVEETLSRKELDLRLADYALPKTLNDQILQPLGYRVVPDIEMTEEDYRRMTKDTIFESEITYNVEKDRVDRSFILVPYTGDINNRVLRKWETVNKEYSKILTAVDKEILKYKGLFVEEFNKYKSTLVNMLKVDDPFTIHFPKIPNFSIVDLESAKVYKKEEVRHSFNLKSIKPRVFVPELDIYVDGGRINLDDFTRNLDDMKNSGTLTDTVKDADNNYHPNVTQDGFQSIINAIFKNGKDLLQWKWQKENEVDSILLENYENKEEAIAAVKAIDI